MDCVRVFIQSHKGSITIDPKRREGEGMNCCSEKSDEACCAEIRVICGGKGAKVSDSEECCS